MLDTETKRRIDTARDILVGKVPDPKSQVEQITIALVYKFMDDMDKESLAMGGKASFFSGEFEKYGWSKIFDPRLGGFEMLALYADAITRMGQNPNLPQLFRDIFKNAYLPYRDPETLKLFLKTIHEFSYDHSERLGDAFEYLLSVLGSQGDAGQFRTPRHIIDFMVRALKPQKNEKILDPACGTAGFLISAYKYILNDPANKKSRPGDQLSPEDKKKLLANFKGYDISPDMVRLSLVNLYLHGFVQPQIYEYDTLTSEERWNDYADVILANPPFMSPKGGIKPHKRFRVQSNRSEVLFVDYMAEHLTPAGRAAIIVPEGIIFQSAGAYRQLRKYLVEQNFLWAVVSLPAGVFNPYAGVKTSILLLDKSLAKKADRVLFVKVEADGFDLGAQRRPVERNDLADALNVLAGWQSAVRNAKAVDFDAQNRSCSALLVDKIRLAESDEYNLTGDRYRESARVKHKKWPMVNLGDVLSFVGSGVTPLGGKETYLNDGVLFIRSQNVLWGICDFSDAAYISKETHDEMARSQVQKHDVLLNITGASIGRSAVYLEDREANVNQHVTILRCKENVHPSFLMNYLISKPGQAQIWSMQSGASRQALNYQQIRGLKIPLPPLEIQRQIVDEIEACQRVIIGARQVVEAWKPNLEVELEEERKSAGVDAWEIRKFGDICENLDGKRRPVTKSDRVQGQYPYYGASGIVDYVDDYIFDGDYLLVSEDGANLLARATPIAFSVSGKVWVNNHAHVLQFKEATTQKFIEIYLNQLDLSLYVTGSAQPKLNQALLNSIPIPFPSLEIQRAIVERIESERRAVEGCRGLIEAYEGKIQKIIGRVWEG